MAAAAAAAAAAAVANPHALRPRLTCARQNAFGLHATNTKLSRRPSRARARWRAHVFVGLRHRRPTAGAHALGVKRPPLARVRSPAN